MYIYDLDDPITRGALADLENAVGAAWVRILHIRPYVSDSQSREATKKSQGKSWTGLTSRIRRSSKKGGSGSKRGIQLLLGNLKNLKNLEYLDVQCLLSDDIEAFQQTIPPIRASFPSYASSLCRLGLKIPLESYTALLSSSVLFHRLTELTVYIYTAEYSTNPVDPIRSALVPFINRHTNCIQSLSVITPETGTADISSMFFILKFFARLSKLRLVFCSLSLEYINLSGIHEFMTAHSNQLEDIVIHFNRMVGLKTQEFHAISFFELPMFRVPLPSLKSLDLGFTGFRDSGGQGTISYVHQFRDTLKHLLLNHTQLSIGNITRLTTSFSTLQSLEIFVYHLNTTLLDLLSTKLTQLSDLRVTFICFSGSQGPFLSANDPVRAHKFCAEMSRRLYLGWSLRRLRVQELSDTAKNLPLCKRALATALPEVDTIDGLPRSSYINDENSLPHGGRWFLSANED